MNHFSQERKNKYRFVGFANIYLCITSCTVTELALGPFSPRGFYLDSDYLWATLTSYAFLLYPGEIADPHTLMLSPAGSSRIYLQYTDLISEILPAAVGSELGRQS